MSILFLEVWWNIFEIKTCFTFFFRKNKQKNYSSYQNSKFANFPVAIKAVDLHPGSWKNSCSIKTMIVCFFIIFAYTKHCHVKFLSRLNFIQNLFVDFSPLIISPRFPQFETQVHIDTVNINQLICEQMYFCTEHIL